MRPLAAWIERDRLLVPCFGRSPVPIEHSDDVGVRKMGVREMRIEFERVQCVLTRPAKNVTRHGLVVLRLGRPRARKVGVRRGKLGIRFARLVEIKNRLIKPFVPRLVPVVAPLEIRLVRTHVM